jgi:hypothetical protein
MKVCHNNHGIVGEIVFNESWNESLAPGFSPCPLCDLSRKYEDVLEENKELKEQLTELNLKMAPELSEDDSRENR